MLYSRHPEGLHGMFRLAVRGPLKCQSWRNFHDQSRKQELSEKAHEEQCRCRDWLLNFMRNNQPKFLSKAELREAAIRELMISKNSFDFAWIAAILETVEKIGINRYVIDIAAKADGPLMHTGI
jgi:hypothetical protein